jgi:hypothetical protein
VDPKAEFAFVEDGERLAGAIPFDMSRVELGHHRGRCSFEAILAKYKLKDPALVELGRIVRSADLLDAEETLEGPGIDMLFRGLLHLSKDDHRILILAEPILDALYATLREQSATRPRGKQRTGPNRKSKGGSS